MTTLPKFYSQQTFEDIVDVVIGSRSEEGRPYDCWTWYERRTDGLYERPLREIRARAPGLRDPEIEALRWRPEGSSAKVLPFPFTAHDFAAFMLDGVGFELLESLSPEAEDVERVGGDVDAAWDHRLRHLFPSNAEARALLFEAVDLHGAALEQFPLERIDDEAVGARLREAIPSLSHRARAERGKASMAPSSSLTVAQLAEGFLREVVEPAMGGSRLSGGAVPKLTPGQASNVTDPQRLAWRVRRDRLAADDLRRRTDAPRKPGRSHYLVKQAVIPLLGDRLVCDVAAADLWSATWGGRPDGFDGSRREISIALRGLFDYAVRQGLMKSSPAMALIEHEWTLQARNYIATRSASAWLLSRKERDRDPVWQLTGIVRALEPYWPTVGARLENSRKNEYRSARAANGKGYRIRELIKIAHSNGAFGKHSPQTILRSLGLAEDIGDAARPVPSWAPKAADQD